MNKLRLASFICGLVVISCVAYAGELELNDVGSYSGTRTDSSANLDVAVPAYQGVLWNEAFLVDVSTNANITIFRAREDSKAAAAVSATTNIWVYTPQASNTINGFTPTTSDYLLVSHSGSSGYQMAQINEIKAWSNATHKTQYELLSTVTCAANDKVYFVDASDNLTVPGKASTDQTNLRNLWTSKRNQPVVLRVPTSAGTSVISGTFKVLR